jgi:hypothetical protein
VRGDASFYRGPRVLCGVLSSRPAAFSPRQVMLRPTPDPLLARRVGELTRGQIKCRIWYSTCRTLSDDAAYRLRLIIARSALSQSSPAPFGGAAMRRWGLTARRGRANPVAVLILITARRQSPYTFVRQCPDARRDDGQVSSGVGGEAQQPKINDPGA